MRAFAIQYDFEPASTDFIRLSEIVTLEIDDRFENPSRRETLRTPVLERLLGGRVGQ